MINPLYWSAVWSGDRTELYHTFDKEPLPRAHAVRAVWPRGVDWASTKNAQGSEAVKGHEVIPMTSA